MPGAMPQNHQQALRDHQPMSRRLKLSLWGASALVVAAAVVAILLSTEKTKPGCLSLNLAGAMGAEPLKACGRDAQQICGSARGNVKQYGTAGVLNVENACRRAGLRIG